MASDSIRFEESEPLLFSGSASDLNNARQRLPAAANSHNPNVPTRINLPTNQSRIRVRCSQDI